jgi:casein kinase II subunit beta
MVSVTLYHSASARPLSRVCLHSPSDFLLVSSLQRRFLRAALTPGAFFGTTFAPLFFQTYPELLAQPFFPAPPTTPSSSSLLGTPSPSPNVAAPGTPAAAPVGGETITNPNPHGGQKPALGKVYVPKIYGFKVSERARSGPRMKWLRERPERADELDNVDWKSRWKDGKGASGAQIEDVHAEMGARAKKAKGRLFDDEDDEVDEEDEEEEEEDAAGDKAQAQQGKTKPPVPPKADGRKR